MEKHDITVNACRIWAGWSIEQKKFFREHSSDARLKLVEAHLLNLCRRAQDDREVADMLFEWSMNYGKFGKSVSGA